MLKYVTVFALLGLIGWVSQMPAAASNENATPALLPATFQALTPCADCPGILTTITLKADGAYKLTRVYEGRSGTFEETGKWTYDRSHARLRLTPNGKGTAEQFHVTFSPQLQTLDSHGNPLPPHASSIFSVVKPEEVLSDTGWTLVELNGKLFIRIEAHPTTMQFDKSGYQVFGSGGCNRYTGTYKQDGNKLTFGVMAATNMFCPGVDGETAYFAMLTKVASFQREGEALTLFDEHGKAIAKLYYER